MGFTLYPQERRFKMTGKKGKSRHPADVLRAYRGDWSRHYTYCIKIWRKYIEEATRIRRETGVGSFTGKWEEKDMGVKLAWEKRLIDRGLKCGLSQIQIAQIRESVKKEIEDGQVSKGK